MSDRTFAERRAACILGNCDIHFRGEYDRREGLDDRRLIRYDDDATPRRRRQMNNNGRRLTDVPYTRLPITRRDDRVGLGGLVPGKEFPVAPLPPVTLTPGQRYVQEITDADIERRFTYHRPEGQKVLRHDNIRLAFKEFAYELAERLPAGREKSLAFTALEEASFWGHAAIAREGK